MSDQTPTYSIVVPVYNPGPPLLDLVQRLCAVFNQLHESFEVLLIDDGSENLESRRYLESAAEHSEVRVIFLSRNFGKPGAVMCGLSHCQGGWVVTIDDDLQQRPEDIPKLLALRDHDVVNASFEKKNHTLVQRITSHIKHLFDKWILDFDIRLSPLKLFKRHVVQGMLLNTSNRPFIPALIRDVTNDIVAVTVSHDPSAYGKSRYTFGARWRQFSNLLIGNSVLLMQLVGRIGIFTMLCSVLLALAIIIRKISGVPTETGWSSVMVVILLIGGLNLGVSSLLGQYLIRILDASSSKPAFIVREIIQKKTS